MARRSGIQGDALGAHPILVFLGVVAGGLFGILEIVFATLALAVLRVL